MFSFSWKFKNCRTAKERNIGFWDFQLGPFCSFNRLANEISFSLFLSVSLCFSLFLSFSLFFSLFLSFSLFFSLLHSVSFFRTIYEAFTLTRRLKIRFVCLSVYLYVFMCVCKNVLSFCLLFSILCSFSSLNDNLSNFFVIFLFLNFSKNCEMGSLIFKTFSTFHQRLKKPSKRQISEHRTNQIKNLDLGCWSRMLKPILTLNFRIQFLCLIKMYDCNPRKHSTYGILFQKLIHVYLKFERNLLNWLLEQKCLISYHTSDKFDLIIVLAPWKINFYVILDFISCKNNRNVWNYH